MWHEARPTFGADSVIFFTPYSFTLFSRSSSQWPMLWDPHFVTQNIDPCIRGATLRVPGRCASCPKSCPTGHTLCLRGPSLRYPRYTRCINPLRHVHFVPVSGGCSAGAVPPLQTCASSVCSRWYKAVTTAPVEHWFRPGRRLRQTPTGGLPLAPPRRRSRCYSHRESDAGRLRLQAHSESE